LDESRKEYDHYWPSFLPDGDHYLYSISGDATVAGIYGGSLKDPGLKTRVVAGASSFVYAPAWDGYSGYLVFWRDGPLLFAQPFDPGGLKTTGDAVALAESAGLSPDTVLGNFSASVNGSLVVGSGSTKRQMTWLDRKGQRIGAAGSPDWFAFPRVSADAGRVALTRGSYGVWVFDFARGVLSPAADRGSRSAAWSPDGHELVYLGGDGTIVRKKYDSTGPGEILTRMKDLHVVPIDVSPDGKFVAFTGVAGIFVLPLDGKERAARLIQPGATFPRVSPDGKWLAYSSSEFGSGEVFVQRFPEAGARWQVSNHGGASPHWRRDGKELYYQSADGQLMVVAVKPSAAGLDFAPPQTLFRLSLDAFLFDVAPDGQRILALLPPEAEKEANELTVLLNWRQGLKK
jgi:WD40 repeat protein